MTYRAARLDMRTSTLKRLLKIIALPPLAAAGILTWVMPKLIMGMPPLVGINRWVRRFHVAHLD